MRRLAHATGYMVLAALSLGLSACGPPPWISLAGCQRVMEPGDEQAWTPIIETADPEPTRVLDARSADPSVLEIVSIEERGITVRALATGETTVTVEAFVPYKKEGYQRSVFPFTVTTDQDKIPKVDKTCFHDDTEEIDGPRPTTSTTTENDS